MDEVERRRFLDTLRRDDEFRATVRRELLTDELLNLPQTVSTLVDVVAQQRQDLTSLATDVRSYMERTITLIGEGFGAVRAETSQMGADISGLRGETSELRNDLSELRGETSELRNDMSELRGETSELRNDLSELRGEMGAGFTAVDARFDQVEAEIRVIKNRLAS